MADHDRHDEQVVDASFVLGFLLPDEKQKLVDSIFQNYEKREIKLISSPLLPFEVSNGLRSAIIRKRIVAALGQQLLTDFLALRIVLQPVDFSKVFALALKHNISAYDASYLWIAHDTKCPLLTLDDSLKTLSHKR